MYILPFGKNRLVSGWQIGGILQYHTGGVMDMTVGWPSEIINARSGPMPPRVDLVPGCKQLLKTINQWVNPNCYTMPPIGEPGNAPYMGTFGPDSTTVDGSLTKNTRISERYNVQFRAEVFNLLNHPNFRTPGQPVTPVFQQASPLPASCATTPSTCSNVLGTVGQVILTNTSSRQIQFGLKLTF
jgi:hypothetical protein